MKNYRVHTNTSRIKDEKCCENPNINIRDGNEVCLNCGMVFEKKYSENERRAFTSEEIEKRKRTELRWRKFGPRTLLPNNKINGKGQYINAKSKALFSRLSKIQKSLVSSIERNLWEAKPKMRQLTSKLNIPPYTQETAWKIYVAAIKKKLAMGRSIKGFIAASLYVAIRVHEIPKLLEEVCNASFTPRRTVIHSLGLLTKEILPELNLNYEPITAKQLIFRFGNELGIPMETQKKALKLLIESSKKGLSTSGKDPKGFAAAAIYLATKSTSQRKTQTEVSEIANTTEVTLRSRAKDIKELL